MVRIGEDAGKGRLMITLEELKKELLADPLVAAEYEALKPKYAKLSGADRQTPQGAPRQRGRNQTTAPRAASLR